MIFQEEPPQTLVEIVKNLYFREEPVNSFYLQEQLKKVGLDVDSRTIRYHILNMEREGLVKRFGRKGVMLTEKGMEEAKIWLLHERFGEMSLESERVFWESNYDLEGKRGVVVVNMVVLKKELLKEALAMLYNLRERQAIVSSLIAIESGPKRVGTTILHEDEASILVLSSRNYDVIFRRRGIPIESAATGILFIENERVKGFSDIVIHIGTTISPGELFIRGGYTSVASYAFTGTGYVTAAIKTFPSLLYDKVIETIEKLEGLPLKKPLHYGYVIPNKFRFTMGDKNKGFIVTFGGANYVAPIVERGLSKEIRIASASYPIELMRDIKEFGI